MGWISNAMRSVSDVPNGGSVDPISLSVAGGLGAANLIGNLVGQSAAAKASREANDFNKWAYEVAMGREDTAVQRRVADLKAAGLSPTLAAGSAAQSMGPISIGANQSVDPSAAIGAGLQGVLATSQVAQTRAQTDLIKEQARATEYGMLSQHFRDKIQEYMLPAEMRNKIASTSKYYADIASLGATTKLNNQTFDRSDSTGQRPGSFFSDFGLGYEKFKSDIGAKDGFLGDHGRVDSKVKKGAKEALRGG